jgi:phosphatidylglycerophosphate synthase
MTLLWRRISTIAGFVLGIGLLAVAVHQVDFGSVALVSRLFGAGLLLALVPGAAWHLVRTEAWRRCFPADVRPPFATLFRIRLAAEAFSYVTLAGVTGEPLKVVLLSSAVPVPLSVAATALERAAYMLVTAAIVSVAAALTAWAMPLTHRWVLVYAWIAIVTAVFAIVPVLLLLRHGAAPGLAKTDPTRPASRVRRFVHECFGQFRTLATGNRSQLGVVAGLEAAAFLMMALEVFAALTLTGTPTTLLASIAIETFTRVASMVSAFIPANLGALEVSNAAAAVALHAASGGVALALLRRIRGLAWCAAGFAVYPRRAQRGSPPIDAPEPDMPAAVETLVALQHADSDALVTGTLGGMPVGERIARAAVRAGYRRLVVWTPRRGEAEWQSATRRFRSRLEVVTVSDLAGWRRLWAPVDPRSKLTVLAPGVVAMPQLLSAARRVVVSCGVPLAELESAADAEYAGSGVFRATAPEMAAPDALAWRLMRRSRRQSPSVDAASGAAALTLQVATRCDLAQAERLLRASIFKPSDGLLGRFNRRLSIPISIFLIRRGRLSANVMSAIVLGLGLYAGWLFSYGDYLTGVAAALLSWAASVLDGCDGELARLQYKDSAFGCWVDTLGDYVYYLAVFAGLTVGAVRQTGWQGLWWCGAALAVGVLLTIALLILLRWQITGGRPERLRSRAHEHFYGSGKSWTRWVATLSTCATRATMPYGIVGLAVLGLLPIVVILATIGAHVYWLSLAREFRGLIDTPAADLVSAEEPIASTPRHSAAYQARTVESAS